MQIAQIGTFERKLASKEHKKKENIVDMFCFLTSVTYAQFGK